MLGSRVQTDEEFWELFREAMRKLAARCRRVRHAKKVRSPQQQIPLHQQMGRPNAMVGQVVTSGEEDAMDVETVTPPLPAASTPQTPFSAASSTPTPPANIKTESEQSA